MNSTVIVIGLATISKTFTGRRKKHERHSMNILTFTDRQFVWGHFFRWFPQSKKLRLPKSIIL